MDTFPKGKTSESENPSIKIFGERFHKDQTLYEYLIEFLLIFTSEKHKNEHDIMCFHDNADEKMSYYSETKVGLKRFIFFADSKKDKSISYDTDAYNNMIQSIKNKFPEPEDEETDKYVACIQDMLKGYSVVVKNRSWCAQQILPLCPELIFCEAQPNQKNRAKNVHSANDVKIDSEFDFTKHNFLARGGELYYLHLLQYLLNNKEKKCLLENLLTNLLTEQSKSLSNLARHLQDAWVESLNLDDLEIQGLYQGYEIKYIPENAYVDCEEYAVDEIINFLESDMELIKKIELLATGIMLQVLRMMTYGIAKFSNTNRNPLIIDMTSNTSDIIKKLSIQSLRHVEDSFNTEVSKAAELISKSKNENDILKQINKGQMESLGIFRSRAKDIRFIIPYQGGNERFSLSENTVRFLVTSMIKPQEKMTLDTFLEKLYIHYDLVIGPNEYKLSANGNIDVNLASSFDYNRDCFEQFLKSTGFLRELSDTTSIVFNPYNNVEVGV